MVLPLLSGSMLIRAPGSREGMEQTQTEGCSEREPLVQLLDELGPKLFSQLTKVLTLLTEGRPVTIGEVAESINVTENEAKDWLVKFGAEFNAGGDVVGLGLTSIPTPHVFEVNGHNLYAWCAGDTLIFPVLLRKTAHIESSDPISGVKIRLTATPEGVQEIKPSTAVLTWPEHADSSDIRGTVCYPSLWFASRETAQKYASKNEGVTIHTPQEFRNLLKIIARTTQTPMAQGVQSLSAPNEVSGGLRCH